MNRKLAIFGLIGAAFALLGLFAGINRIEPEAPEDAAVANLLSLSLPDSTGKAQPMAQWKGKGLIVNFWATWCEPCVDEMPELSALHSELAPRDIQVLGIGIDSKENIARFGSQLKIAYPLFSAGLEGTELARQFGNKVGGLPFTVLVDRTGNVRKTYIGRLKMQELRQDLSLLAH